MAVQKNRKTRSKRGMRRSHDALTSAALTEDTNTVKFTVVTTFPLMACTVAAR